MQHLDSNTYMSKACAVKGNSGLHRFRPRFEIKEGLVEEEQAGESISINNLGIETDTEPNVALKPEKFLPKVPR